MKKTVEIDLATFYSDNAKLSEALLLSLAKC